MHTNGRVLLLGSGSSRDRRLLVGERSDWSNQIVLTVDRDPSHNTDFVHDLNCVPWPFEDNYFQEVHAYEILEHLGSLGDENAFFAHFYEIWRILEPEGHLAVTCPVWNGPWLFQDPGHRRVIGLKSVTFLDQTEYQKQIGYTPMTDYRSIWKGDFKYIVGQETSDTTGFVLQAVKPARI